MNSDGKSKTTAIELHSCLAEESTSKNTATSVIRKTSNEKIVKSIDKEPPPEINIKHSSNNLKIQQFKSDTIDSKALSRQKELDDKYGG